VGGESCTLFLADLTAVVHRKQMSDFCPSMLVEPPVTGPSPFLGDSAGTEHERRKEGENTATANPAWNFRLLLSTNTPIFALGVGIWPDAQ
jgi:hypothetical protein